MLLRLVVRSSCGYTFYRVYYDTSHEPIGEVSQVVSAKADRHKDDTQQYNVRIPKALRAEFIVACKARKLQPATIIRTLMQGFVDVSREGRSQEVPHE